MPPARLDIATIINLLAIGNISFALILLAYKNNLEARRSFRFFTLAKLLQAAAWLLIGLRGGISDLASIYLANVLLVGGFSLETLALTTVQGPSRRWERVYAGLAAAGILGYLLFGRAANLRVAIASLATLALFATASACLLRTAAESRLRGVVGLLFLAFSGALALRAALAFQAGPEFQILSWSWAQISSFIVVFIIMMVDGVIFMLLHKEVGDRSLNESEQKYRTLVEQTGEAILILRAGRIAFANQSVSSLLGVPPEQVLGQDFLPFVHPEDRARVLARDEQRIRGDQPADGCDFRFVGRQGRTGWVTLSASRVTWKGAPATLNLLTDITGRKRLELEREEMLRNLQKAMSEIKILSGLLPICASCKKIRDDQGFWYQLESYIVDHSEAVFTHGICPDCRDSLYPGTGRPRKLLKD